MTEIRIGNRTIGSRRETLIVAELGGNAARDYATAEALVRAAKEAGADACKSQCFTADTMTLPLDTPPFRLTWAGQETTLYQLYQRTAMPLEWHAPLKALAESIGLLYLASVFDQAGIDLMVGLDVPALKIASFEVTDLPLIRAAARAGKPLIISTGMATFREIAEAAGATGDCPFVLLKCTSAYPAPVSAANLRALPGINFSGVGGCVGLSDHSRSNAAVSAAVALGACIVERHLTLDRTAGGPDAAFSDEPHEFAAMVRAIRETSAALGTVHYGPTEAERPMLRFRRSIWVTRDIAAGEVLTPDNLAILRPADGLEPRHWDEVIGKRARVAIGRGTPLAWELLE